MMEKSESQMGKIDYSICVVAYNRLELLKKTLATIEENTRGNYELFVWDNKSTDGTKEYLESLPKQENVRIHVSKDNLGAGRACNVISTWANGKYFLRLDDDVTRLPKDWNVDLAKVLEADRKIGLAIAICNCSPQEYIERHEDEIVFSNGFHLRYRLQAGGGYCCATPLSLFKSLGGYPTMDGFRYFYEDSLYVAKINEHGLKCVHVADISVKHEENSFTGDSIDGLEEKKRFWEHFIKEYPDPNVSFARERIKAINSILEKKNHRKGQPENELSVGVHAPYLPFLGGGERVAVKIAEALAKENQVDLLVPEVVEKERIWQRFGIDLKAVNFRIVKEGGVSAASADYDVFINSLNYYPCRAGAKKNIAYYHFPFTSKASKSPAEKFLNLIGLGQKNNLDDYQQIVSNSRFTQQEIKKRWGKDSIIINPPAQRFQALEKKKIILNVGRFISVGHCKKQLELVKAFRKLHQAEKEWELHFAGAVNEEKRHLDYLETVKREAEGLPVKFHINAPFERLAQLYGQAGAYWHATGYGEDEEKEPWKMEHFGISTVEAMSAGCVPIVINKGGQKEIVNRENGFLWNTLDELVEQTKKVIRNKALAEKLGKKAVKDSEQYSEKHFEEKIIKLVKG